MIKNLFLLTVVLLNGCVLYVEPDHSHSAVSSDSVLSVWLEDVSVHCDYDSYWETSTWYLEIYADTPRGYDFIEYVDFYVDYYQRRDMTYTGSGRWIAGFDSSWTHCHDYVEFEFRGVDYEGSRGYYIVVW